MSTGAPATTTHHKRAADGIAHYVRSQAAPSSSSPTSLSSPGPSRKRARVTDYLTTSVDPGPSRAADRKRRVLSASTRIFFKRVQIGEDKAEEYRQLASQLGAVLSDLDHANLILTDTWSAARAKAGLPPELYEKRVHVVNAQWLEDTAEQGVFVSLDKYRVLSAPDASSSLHNEDKPQPTLDEDNMRLPLRGLWAHVLPAKLDPVGVETLSARLLALGADIVPQDKADIIISRTGLFSRAKPFLKEHKRLPPIIRAQWIDQLEVRKSWVDPEDEYVDNLPCEAKWKPDEAVKLARLKRSPPPGSLLAKDALRIAKVEQETQEKTTESKAVEEASVTGVRDEEEPEWPPPLLSRETTPGSQGSATVVDEDTDELLRQYEYKNTEFACQRPSPLRCINQGLVDELHVIQKQRELVDEKRSALSYERALSAIKAYREDLSKDPGAAGRIKGIGTKIGGLVKQYYKDGHIAEAQQIRSDAALRVMMDFMELYGIGPTTARSLYNEGCRTVEDVIRAGRSYGTKLDPRECIKILPDLRQRIPRHEVEAIARTVMDMADELVPGTLHTICGGYRRGKPASGDVDIVITHPQHEPGIVCHKLIDALKAENLVTHVIGLSNRDATEEEHGAPTAHNVAELVFKAKPSKTDPNPLHRRLDLIFCRRSVYGACVVGWTGSTLFERDIRRWATKKRNYKFHNYGISDRATGAIIETPEEQDVFDELGLEWIPPTLRNCNA